MWPSAEEHHCQPPLCPVGRPAEYTDPFPLPLFSCPYSPLADANWKPMHKRIQMTQSPEPPELNLLGTEGDGEGWRSMSLEGQAETVAHTWTPVPPASVACRAWCLMSVVKPLHLSICPPSFHPSSTTRANLMCLTESPA